MKNKLPLMMLVRIVIVMVILVIFFNLWTKDANAETIIPIPEIRIKHGHFLDSMLPFTKYSRVPNEVRDKVGAYQKAWDPYGSDILAAMTKKLACAFRQTKIDVYIVGRYSGAYSDPLVMSAGYEIDEFVPLLTHEIAHRLLTDNTMDMPVGEIWAEMFPSENRMARNHIIVFALMRYVFVDALKRPDLLKSEYDTARGAYREAWDVVDEQGYENILTRFIGFHPKDNN